MSLAVSQTLAWSPSEKRIVGSRFIVTSSGSLIGASSLRGVRRATAMAGNDLDMYVDSCLIYQPMVECH